MTEHIVAAIVVLYHPEPASLRFAVQALLAQAQWLICVDNSGCEVALLHDIAAMGPGRVCCVDMGGNLGVGAAINRGIEMARNKGCSHVVLCDQDSIPQPGMIGEMLRVEVAGTAWGLDVSAVGPRCVSMDGGHHAHFLRCGSIGFKRVNCKQADDWVVADFLISSGSLIRMSVIDAIGAMDEGFFIDMVDTDWFLRANHSGWVALGACRATMVHRLGEQTRVIYWPRQRTLAIHRPARYYYMFRNRLVLYRRRYAPLSWVVPDMLQLLQIALYFGVIHSARLQNLRMMLRGCIDGLRGVSGERPIQPLT